MTANRTCVLLASEDMITQRINTHFARAKRATVSVGKHLGDGRSETPAEESLPNVRRETSLKPICGKVRQKTKRGPVEVHLLSLLRRHVSSVQSHLFLGLISYMGSPKPFSLTCGYFFKETHFCG